MGFNSELIDLNPIVINDQYVLITKKHPTDMNPELSGHALPLGPSPLSKNKDSVKLSIDNEWS